ncbi:MAG TPA: PAS domain S-box protein, partial [Chroococcidiopsis sp.]
MVYASTSKLAQAFWDSNLNPLGHDLNRALSQKTALAGRVDRESADADELAIWGQVLQQVATATGWGYGEVWVPNAEQTHLHCRGLWHHSEWVLQPLESAPVVACNEGLSGQTWLTQQPVWSEGLQESGQGQDPSVALDALEWQPSPLLEARPAIAMAGGLGIPVTVAGEPLAVLVFGLPQASDRVMAPAAMAIATQAITIVQLQYVQSALTAHYQRQMHLLDALPGIVFCCTNDPKWTLSYLSQGCVDLTGYSTEELLGPDSRLTYNDVIMPQDWPLVAESMQQAIAQRQPYGVEYRICTKSGEIKWLWEKGRALYDSHGNVLGLEGFITDITERKLVETALQTSKAQNHAREVFLQLILDNIPQQIFWKDQNLIYRGANRQFAQLYGFDSPSQIVGKTDYDLTDPSQAEKWRDRDRSILATGKPELHIICNKQTADGHDAWIDMNKVPIHDDAGQTIGILGTLGDFTDRKQAEDTLAKRDRYLTALVEIHRHMLANGDSEHLYADVTQTLGYASGADRVELYINSRDSNGNLYMSLKSAWNADGIPPSRANPHEQIPYAQFSPDWLQQMSNGESHSALVKHLPAADRQFC